MRIINIETMIQKIKDCVAVNSLIPPLTQTTTISYSCEGKLSYVWLHGNRGETCHRVSYSLKNNNYILEHYIWNTKRGWVLVGEIKMNSIKNFQVKNI